MLYDCSRCSALFTGQTVCFTGTLKSPKHIPRKEAWQLVVESGGQVSKSITRKTTILVCGVPSARHNPSNKLSRAKKINLSILSMEEFFEGIGAPHQMSFRF